MTKEEILKMEAGPEIDALFAELVMGLTADIIEDMCRKEYAQNVKSQIGAGALGNETWDENCADSRKKMYRERCIPDYSTNISHAFEGVERMEDPWFSLTYQGNQWCCKVGFGQAVVGAETKELAITRALILWAMEKEATNEVNIADSAKY